MNIVQDYIDYVMKSYRNLLLLLLKNQYPRKIIDLFLKEYLEVRYCGKKTEIVLDDQEIRINTALEKVQESQIGKIKPGDLEEIYNAFQWIEYIDEVTNNNCLEQVTKTHTEEEKQAIVELSKQIKKKRKEYLALFDSNKFHLETDSLGNRKGMELVSITHTVTVSKLYSEYAIEKAFNEGVINEDKLFVEYCLVAAKILKKTIAMEKVGHYIIDFTPTLFKKNKKLHRLIEIINHPLVLEHTSIKIQYSDFLKYKEDYENLIRRGVQLSVVLDDHFECDDAHLEQLVIFERVLIDMKYQNYDYIKEHKGKIQALLLDVTLTI